jgi:chaperonin cofactor prefoldin
MSNGGDTKALFALVGKLDDDSKETFKLVGKLDNDSKEMFKLVGKLDNDSKAIFKLVGKLFSAVNDMRKDLNKEKEARRKSEAAVAQQLTAMKSRLASTQEVNKEKFNGVNRRLDKLEVSVEDLKTSVSTLNNTVNAMVNQFKGVKYVLIVFGGLLTAFMLYGAKIKQILDILWG